MKDNDSSHILTVNAGSSSIKLAVFMGTDPLVKVSEASVSNIGEASPATLKTDDRSDFIKAQDHTAAAQALLRWFEEQTPTAKITAVGHRVVHGGPRYYATRAVTDELLNDLQQLTIFDPEHLPIELQLIQTFKRLLPSSQHVVCFDTAFHHDLPTEARLLPIPRRFEAKGIRRYGFHGLSYASIVEELRRVEGDVAAHGNVIVAHLGSGASLAALKDGKSIDTTMSMTPASGITMSSRAGDLDPGLMLYLARVHDYDASKFNHMVNFESGLLGISETSADMKKLLEIEAKDKRAKDAVDVFCYQVRKSIGSLAAALGGLNTLVFTGGIGENAPDIRARICQNLDFLGVRLDPVRNQESMRLISEEGALVGVHVIHADEAMTIARETARLMHAQTAQGAGL